MYGQSRRAAGPSDEEKEEDLEMSKELVNVLIKEVYNKLLKDVGPEGVKNVSRLRDRIFVGTRTVNKAYHTSTIVGRFLKDILDQELISYRYSSNC